MKVHMRFKDYYKPTSIAEALILLRGSSQRTQVLAGGTWLNAGNNRNIDAVIDVGQLCLGNISRVGSPPALRIGATVTLQTLVDAFTDSPGLEVISQAAHAMAALNIRNQATVVGSVITSDAASPLATALLTCDAELVVYAAEERVVSLGAFLSYREQIMAEKVLVTAIQMPIPSADTASSYQRVARTPRDYPIVCVAARCAVRDGIIGNMRIAVGGVAPTPIRLTKMELALEKKNVRQHFDAALADAISELTPTDSWLGSSEYRRTVAAVLVRRAVSEAAHLTL